MSVRMTDAKYWMPWMSAFALWACSPREQAVEVRSPAPTSLKPADTDKPAPSVVEAAPAASAVAKLMEPPAQAAERVQRHGIAFAVNMTGEIEPCGCKANPTGGLARRAHVLSLWEKGAQAAPADISPAHWYSRVGTHAFDSFTLLDAGDAFSDAAQLPEPRLMRLREVAKLMVQRFGQEGMKAQLIGERDLALGFEFLQELSKQAKYPFIASNLVTLEGQASAFAPYAIVSMGEAKVAVIGLLDTSASVSRGIQEAKLTLLDPVVRLKALETELASQGVSSWVLLSQLRPQAEQAVMQAFPQISLILGGESVRMTEQPEALGKGWLLAGGHKGRQLGMAVLELGDKRGWNAPWIKPVDERGHAQRTHTLKAQIARFEQLLAESSGEAAAEAEKAKTSHYLQRIAGLRAELTLLNTELEEAKKAPTSSLNRLHFQLISLGQEVPHNQSIKDEIDAFVRKHPPI